MNILIIYKLYQLDIIYNKYFFENGNYFFTNIENFEIEKYLPIQQKLEGFIEMAKDEQKFLNGLIRKIRPKKLVEIGVAFGGTSALILNAINDINNSKLFSIDINKNCYRNRSKKTGFIVKERFLHLSNKWKLYTGGLTSEFIENIGNEIDFVYIDTVHSTPGEMLNWLEVLPFLKEEAFVVLHDTFLMYFNNRITKRIINYSNRIYFLFFIFFTIIYFYVFSSSQETSNSIISDI